MPIMHLIKKHAALLSVLSALLMIAAAPYLIPENPDSEVFRSGTLGFLLILTACFPVKQAFESADRRTLLCAMATALLFAFALSLGSELRAYGGLLPGMGSLLRRFAVPAMAAPMLGGLFARLMLIPVPKAVRQLRIPTLVFAAVIFLCWAPVLLAYFPGLLNYDFLGEYAQHTTGEYTNLHPLLHSVIMNSVIALGTAIGSPTLGLLMMSLLQMALLALALAYSCGFARDHGAPLTAQAILCALYGLHPVFSLMSISMTKDTLFSACVLVLSLMAWQIIEAPDAFFAQKRRLALFVVCTIGAGLLRVNGVFALVLLLPAIVVAAKAHRRKAALLCGTSAAAAVLTFGVLSLIYAPESMPSYQLYSIPAQQLVRAYNVGEMTDEEKAELRTWYVDPPEWAHEDIAFELHPHLADSAKGYLDKEKLAADGSGFLDLWARVGKKNARVYMEAFLMLNVGSWYPDDLTHSTIYPDAGEKELGYLQTYLYDAGEFELKSLLPQLERLMERICVRNRYQRYPIAPLLFNTATPMWVIAFSCAWLVAKRRSHLLPVSLAVFGLWASYLFGPCTLPRYVMPLFALAPVLLIAVLCTKAADKP